MFIAEMIIFCAFLVLLCFCTNFISLVICLFGLGLALGCDYPDRAHDHFGKHSQHQPRQAGARRLRLPGGRRARRHRRSAISSSRRCPNSAPGAGCSPPRSFRPCSSRSAASTSSRAPIGCPSRGEHRQGGAGGDQAAGAQAAISVRDQAGAARRRPPTAAAVEADLCVVVQQRQPARHDPRLGAVVPAGSRHLRHRHLHPDDPGRRASAPIPITPAASPT